MTEIKKTVTTRHEYQLGNVKIVKIVDGNIKTYEIWQTHGWVALITLHEDDIKSVYSLLKEILE